MTRLHGVRDRDADFLDDPFVVDEDIPYCQAPGRTGGLCFDDICRGCGICMHDGAIR